MVGLTHDRRTQKTNVTKQYPWKITKCGVSMKIAITGGTGFVGMRLIETLSKIQSLEINALSRKGRNSDSPNVDWYLGDLNSHESLRAFLDGCDIVCNCAGEITEPKNYHANNVRGVESLYNASVDAGAQLFIQLSSAGIYDELVCGEMNEESEKSACNDYELSKIDAENILFKRNEIKTIILRPTTVYGVDMPNDSLRSLLSAVRRKQFFFIGSKNAISTYISVNNVISAIVGLIDQKDKILEGLKECDAYNLSDDMCYFDFLDLAARELKVDLPVMRIPLFIILGMLWLNDRTFGVTLPLTVEKAKILGRMSTFSSQKFMDSFSWKPTEPHSKTIKDCINHWFE